jgi:nuclear GTP-binding protein
LEKGGEKKFNEDKRIQAGQSKRIWEELYKVIDSSDVICMVLDARDPLGTKCEHAEIGIKAKSKFKHLVYVLNKTDLVPSSVTVKWVKYLSQFHPTIAFRAGANQSFGRQSLI